MNVKIHARQIEMNDSLRIYAERHIADQLTTIYKGQAATLDIEFSEAVGGREKTCQVTLFIPKGKTIVASAQDANLYAAIDICAEKISRALRHYKEKRQDAVRQTPRPREELIAEPANDVHDMLEDEEAHQFLEEAHEFHPNDEEDIAVTERPAT